VKWAAWASDRTQPTRRAITTGAPEPRPAYERWIEHESFGDKWVRYKSDDDRRTAFDRFTNVDTLTPVP
jgi:hypothetical protein